MSHPVKRRGSSELGQQSSPTVYDSSFNIPPYSLTMTSPSQPVNIRSRGRLGPNDGNNNSNFEGQPGSFLGTTPTVGTPDLRALRAQYAGTPPLPNIPPRGGGGTPTGARGGNGTPSTAQLPSDPSPLGVGSSTPSRPGPQPVGGLSATKGLISDRSDPQSIADLDDLPAEEKAKVLERHLVAKGQRTKPNSDDALPTKSSTGSILDVPTGTDSDVTARSRRSSASQHHAMREESEPFPIPYDAHGADVT